MRRFVLGLAIVAAVGAGIAAQSIHGNWILDVTLDPQGATTAEFLDVGTRIQVTYDVGGWAFTAFSQLSDAGWIDQTFAVGGVIGMFAIGMDLNLDPAGAFETWDVTVGTMLGGVGLDFDFSLADLDTTFVVGASSTSPELDIAFSTTLGGDDNDICDFSWAGFDVTFEFSLCCADVSATVEFDCSGFDHFQFDVESIEIPRLPWVTLDAELTFRMQTKELVLSPDFDFDPGLCFDLYVSVEKSGNLMLGDISINGIKLACSFEHVNFTGISFWGTSGKPGELGPYWQMYKLASNEETCCGPLSFQTSIFFGQESHNLFDISSFMMRLQIELGDPFEFSLGFETDADAGTAELALGLEVTF